MAEKRYTIHVGDRHSFVYYGELEAAKNYAELCVNHVRLHKGSIGHIVIMEDGDDMPAAYKEYNDATRKYCMWTR